MTEPLPSDGGPLLGLKPPPTERESLLSRLFQPLLLGACLSVALGIWLAPPLLLVAIWAAWVTGNLLFVMIWAVVFLPFFLYALAVWVTPPGDR